MSDSKRLKSNLPVVTEKRLPVTQTPLQIYLREISRYSLLTPEEEYQLAAKHFNSNDREAAQRLITSNLRLVVKIANDFRSGSPQILDVIQEGMVD